MEKKSIWGDWWTSQRDWVYPSWLAYELTTCFYDYTEAVHNHFEENHGKVTSLFGEFGSRTLEALCEGVTFFGSSAFLTVPACLALYKFFREDNLTGTSFEEQVKKYL